MFGLNKLKNEMLILENAYRNDSITLKGLVARVEQLEITSKELVENVSQNNYDLSLQTKEDIKSFCELGEVMANLKEKVFKIEKRSKPGRKPKGAEMVEKKRGRPPKEKMSDGKAGKN